MECIYIVLSFTYTYTGNITTMRDTGLSGEIGVKCLAVEHFNM